MRVTICGVRGSTPAPGADYLRYGGHTACVAISRSEEDPTLVIDAGTGLRRLSDRLGNAVFRGTILLSHLHWDHVQGMPFFTAGLRPGQRAQVLLPSPDGEAVTTLERGFSPPHFPIRPRELGPGWSFDRLQEGTMELEGYQVLVRELPHRGGQTFGFRVSDGSSTLAYLTDHSPTDLGPGPDGYGAHHDAAMELAAGADLMIHDAQFLASDYPAVAYLGHSSGQYACSLAKAAGVASVLLFHHAPSRTDDEIDEIVGQLAGFGVPVEGARESAVLDL